MPYRKALLDLSARKFTQQEYSAYMDVFYKNSPFCDICGSINPYTGTKVNTWHDYMLYAHCYVIKHLTEAELSSMEVSYKNEISVLRSRNKDLENFKSVSSSRIKALSIQRTFFAIFLFLCLIFLFFANPLTDDLHSLQTDIQFLRDENEALKNSLSLAEEQIVSLTDLADTSYANGYSDASKKRSNSTVSSSSSGHSYVPYDSSPVSSTSYIGNSSTGKFHRSSCGYLPAKSNQVPLASRDYAISQGYSPCKRCDP